MPSPPSSVACLLATLTLAAGAAADPGEESDHFGSGAGGGAAASAGPVPPPLQPLAPAPPGSPNVLMIAIDDMRPSLGAMDAPVLTPHMDKLASESLM